MEQRQNLVFIMTDHQRADSIGMVQTDKDGQSTEVCPTLNRLAAEGAYFSRMYNASPLCVPARTALATGKYPTDNGIVYNDWQGTCASQHLTLHQILAESGYDVAHIGVDHIRVSPPLREQVDFVKWIDKTDHQRYLKDLGLTEPTKEPISAFKRTVRENQWGRYVQTGYSNTYCSQWHGAAEHFKDRYFCQQAVDFLEAQAASEQKKPFALFLYLWAPHPPFWVPEPYQTMFPPEKIDLPSNVGQTAKDEPFNRRHSIARQLAEGICIDEWRQVWAAHMGLVRLADDGIGQVLETLKQRDQFEQSLIVYTSDHGDHLGQHRMYQKMEMYEEAMRVPAIIRLPDATVQSSNRPVSHLDLMPTVLDLFNLAQPDRLDGISLAGMVTATEPVPNRSIYCQYSGNPTLGDIRRAVVTQRYKYIYDPTDQPELYDLEQDPQETKNCAADPAYQSVQQELHQDLKSWSQQHGDWIQFD